MAYTQHYQIDSTSQKSESSYFRPAQTHLLPGQQRRKEISYMTYGGSRSSGQPSPGSFVEELQSRFKVNNHMDRGSWQLNQNREPVVENTFRPTTRTTLDSRPYYQSELTLPTMRVSEQTNFELDQGYRNQNGSLNCVNGISNASSTTRLASQDFTFRPITAIDTLNPSTRGGPSFRKLHTLYGSSTSAQKKFPSDNTLNRTYLNEELQQPPFTPVQKTGTVKIQVRSRSAQASPTGSPNHSPNLPYKVANPEKVRTHQVIVPAVISRTQSSPPRHDRERHSSSSADGPQGVEDEFQTLPSVRDIIRQVEEMTQKNCATPPTETPRSNDSRHRPSFQQSAGGHQPRALGRSESYRSYDSRNVQRSISATSVALPKSQYSYQSSSNHLRNGNESRIMLSSTTPPSIPPRRNDHLFESDMRQSANATPVGSRKADLLSNLPLDYQKLRESFLEQRREIQRLRKDLADKDRMIADLMVDIRLYEPWR